MPSISSKLFENGFMIEWICYSKTESLNDEGTKIILTQTPDIIIIPVFLFNIKKLGIFKCALKK